MRIKFGLTIYEVVEALDDYVTKKGHHIPEDWHKRFIEWTDDKAGDLIVLTCWKEKT